MRDYMDSRVTPPNQVTSLTWGPSPPSKQALKWQQHGNSLQKVWKNCSGAKPHANIIGPWNFGPIIKVTHHILVRNLSALYDTKINLRKEKGDATVRSKIVCSLYSMCDPMKVDFVIQEGGQAITLGVRATNEGESISLYSVFICSLPILNNCHLEIDVCRKLDCKSL